MKAQSVRIIDVLFLGPMMVYAGTRRNALPELVRAVLVLGGVATVAYNWRNYVIESQRRI